MIWYNFFINSKIYPFLNKRYALKFKYLLFEINNVKTNIDKNKLEIVIVMVGEEYQSILKTVVIKIYENITENINEEKMIGINSIIDSKIINLKILDFSKPKILRTRFW